MIAACEQCGRSRIPQVAAPVALRDYLAGTRREGLRLVLSPAAPGSLAGLASLPSKVELLIGPEGGLDDDELLAAQKAGFMPVRLGPRVLRTETAAVVALTVLQALWGICSRTLLRGPGLLGDHLLEALEVRDQRRLVDHAHLADDRAALAGTRESSGCTHVGADAHQLREALRQHAEIAAACDL